MVVVTGMTPAQGVPLDPAKRAGSTVASNSAPSPAASDAPADKSAPGAENAPSGDESKGSEPLPW